MNQKSLPSFFSLVKAFLPSAIWAAVIFLFSSQTTLPSLDYSWQDFILKKLAHIFVYAVLFILLHRGVNQVVPDNHPLKKHSWKLALGLAFLYAVSDEFHQSFVPGRYGTIRDLGYDMLGASIAMLRRYGYI